MGFKNVENLTQSTQRAAEQTYQDDYSRALHPEELHSDFAFVTLVCSLSGKKYVAGHPTVRRDTATLAQVTRRVSEGTDPRLQLLANASGYLLKR